MGLGIRKHFETGRENNFFYEVDMKIYKIAPIKYSTSYKIDGFSLTTALGATLQNSNLLAEVTR